MFQSYRFTLFFFFFLPVIIKSFDHASRLYLHLRQTACIHIYICILQVIICDMGVFRATVALMPAIRHRITNTIAEIILSIFLL